MTINSWLTNAIKKLETASVPTARLDTEVLLADILDKDRTWVHAHPDYVLHRSDLCILDEQVDRRITHEPLAYIRGKQEFYGRDFVVSSDTLTPRPETETIIDILLKTLKSDQLVDDEQLQIIDVGTGSGCILITSALEIAKIKNQKSKISYIGLDISEPALEIAKRNAKKLKAKVNFRQFDLLTDNISSVMKPNINTVVLANLPYVPNDFHINLAAGHEPGFAIFGGKDGLDYYHLLFVQLSKMNLENVQMTVMTEALPPQHNELANIAKESGFRLEKTQDFIQVFKKL